MERQWRRGRRAIKAKLEKLKRRPFNSVQDAWEQQRFLLAAYWALALELIDEEEVNCGEQIQLVLQEAPADPFQLNLMNLPPQVYWSEQPHLFKQLRRQLKEEMQQLLEPEDTITVTLLEYGVQIRV